MYVDICILVFRQTECDMAVRWPDSQLEWSSTGWPPSHDRDTVLIWRARRSTIGIEWRAIKADNLSESAVC